MATTLISPGVLALENDNSFVSQQPVTVGASLIGPTVKGPVEIPTIVTSYSDYQNKFGTTFFSASQVYTYFTSVAAFNYFANGGDTLLVSRVVSGSFTSATTSTGSVTAPNGGGVSILNSASLAECLVLKTISQGTIMNSSGSLDSTGALATGSSDNIRWQITNQDTSQGTFTLLIHRGDDNPNTPVILETFTNVSLDPNQPNYIEAVVGNLTQNTAYDSSTGQYYIQTSGSYANASRYVRVKEVLTPTYNYFEIGRAHV